MKLAIVGSRDFNNYCLLKETIDEFRINNNIEQIVSGGAIGADKLAEKYSRENNMKLPPLIILPDWTKHGKAAGPIRNKEIVQNADHIIAFWNGISKGTKSTIDIAKTLNKPIDIINF